MIEYAMNTTGMTEAEISESRERFEANHCPKCGGELVVGSWPFCGGGHAPAEKLYNVIGDEIQGGFVQENFGDKPETFYSKRAMALRAKELGLRPMVRHKGEQGSDKSPRTVRWV